MGVVIGMRPAREPKVATRRKRQSWSVGDVFAVALENGKSVLGLVVDHEPKALNSVAVAFFDQMVDTANPVLPEVLQAEQVFAVQLATKDGLDWGRWRVLGASSVEVPRAWNPYEGTRSSGFVGAKVRGSGILDGFLRAFYGLEPWDGWHDPTYADQLLLSPDKKPTTGLIYKSAGGVR